MKRIIFLLLIILPKISLCDTIDMNVILESARNNCIGIADEITNIKNKNIGNITVSSIGAVAAGGALYAGITKEQIDKKLAEIEKSIQNAENLSDEEFFKFLITWSETENALEEMQEYQELTDDSKQHGNIRTGLMAGNTATAITNAALSGNIKNQSEEVSDKIKLCLQSISELTPIMGQMHISGNKSDREYLQNIINTCEEFHLYDIDKVTNANIASLATSSANIATATTATITSALANSKDIRNGDPTKEKRLNKTANAFSGISAGISATSSILNATTIKTIKNVQSVAQRCEGALTQ